MWSTSVTVYRSYTRKIDFSYPHSDYNICCKPCGFYPTITDAAADGDDGGGGDDDDGDDAAGGGDGEGCRWRT